MCRKADQFAEYSPQRNRTSWVILCIASNHTTSRDWCPEPVPSTEVQRHRHTGTGHRHRYKQAQAQASIDTSTGKRHKQAGRHSHRWSTKGKREIDVVEHSGGHTGHRSSGKSERDISDDGDKLSGRNRQWLNRRRERDTSTEDDEDRDRGWMESNRQAGR